MNSTKSEHEARMYSSFVEELLKEVDQVGEYVEHLYLTKGGRPFMVRVANIFSVEPKHPSKPGCYIVSSQGFQVECDQSFIEVVERIDPDRAEREDEDDES